jgi:hypothetical protein
MDAQFYAVSFHNHIITSHLFYSNPKAGDIFRMRGQDYEVIQVFPQAKIVRVWEVECWM